MSWSLSLKPEPPHRSPPIPVSGCLKAGEEVKVKSTVSDTLRLRIYITKAQETCGSLGYPSHPMPSLLLLIFTMDWKHLFSAHTWDKFVFYTFPHLDCSVVLLFFLPTHPLLTSNSSASPRCFPHRLFYSPMNDRILL